MIEQIDSDINEAIKEKNVYRLQALRTVKSAIMLEAIKHGVKAVSDKTSLRIIAKLVKQRKDSADILIKKNRQDLAKDEIAQSVYLQEYLS